MEQDCRDDPDAVAAVHRSLCEERAPGSPASDSQAVEEINLGVHQLGFGARGQFAEVDLAVGKQRQTGHCSHRLRNHVARKSLRDGLPNLRRVHLRRSHEQDETRRGTGTEAFKVIPEGGRSRRHRKACGLRHAARSRHGKRGALDLRGLDADAIDLHLAVQAPDDLQAVGPPRAEIARQVEHAVWVDHPESALLLLAGLEVTLQHSTEADLAHLPELRDGVHLAVHQHDQRVRLRVPDRRIHGSRLQCGGPSTTSRLACAVHVVQTSSGTDLGEAPHRRHGQRIADRSHVLQ
mmetsp:Transcript_49447/g.142199  ORF Transcript_49447/g.142199 Transcript_49447/m.142199 type:complete len:293 (+) Transcript_49447:1109-1987(+)